MEWKTCREQHPGGMGDSIPHINNMSDQRIRSYLEKKHLSYTKSDSQNLFIVLFSFLPHIPPFPHSPPSSTRKIRGVSKADLVLVMKTEIFYNNLICVTFFQSLFIKAYDKL